MAGVIMGHLTQLGIVVKNDGGSLFGLAVLTFALSLFILWNTREHIPIIVDRFKK